MTDEADLSSVDTDILNIKIKTAREKQIYSLFTQGITTNSFKFKLSSE